MPKRQVVADDGVPAQLRKGLERLADQVGLPTSFPAGALAEAEAAAERGVDLGLGYADDTAVPFVTIDPEGSTDLDQALHIERAGTGYEVWYAIADVGGWVPPGGALDAETHARGQTFYAPGRRFPLHPPVLSEAAASLLADGTPRPAQVWRISLDSAGAVLESGVHRGLVVSTAKLSYAGVQKMLDEGTAPEPLQLLAEVGKLRERQEIDRGGVSLNLPEQEIRTDGGQWTVAFRAALPVEGWNAQISLLTGICAAEIMQNAGVGLLRTLPPADPQSIKRLRQVARSLQIPWPASMGYPDFVRSLDTNEPTHEAMMNSCATLFRGAGYTVIDPDQPERAQVHAALATHYAHVTAPLRRLVDRYAGEVCLALCADQAVPQWVLAALDELPSDMGGSDARAKKFERGVVDLVEALVLHGRVGEVFEGTIIELNVDRGPGEQDRGVVSIPQLAIEAPVNGAGLKLGEEFELVLQTVDVDRGVVTFIPRR